MIPNAAQTVSLQVAAERGVTPEVPPSEPSLQLSHPLDRLDRYETKSRFQIGCIQPTTLVRQELQQFCQILYAVAEILHVRPNQTRALVHVQNLDRNAWIAAVASKEAIEDDGPIDLIFDETTGQGWENQRIKAIPQGK